MPPVPSNGAVLELINEPSKWILLAHQPGWISWLLLIDVGFIDFLLTCVKCDPPSKSPRFSAYIVLIFSEEQGALWLQSRILEPAPSCWSSHFKSVAEYFYKHKITGLPLSRVLSPWLKYDLYDVVKNMNFWASAPKLPMPLLVGLPCHCFAMGCFVLAVSPFSAPTSLWWMRGKLALMLKE